MTAIRKLLLVLAIALGGLLPSLPAHALNGEETQALKKISDFFNSFRTLKGEFTQISPRGRVATGVFYIAKPGRMRFEYAPPVPFVIVSDGSWVAMRNNKKATVDYYPLSKTPLRMVLASRVNLARDAIIKKVEERNGLTIVTLQDKDRMVPGHLVLVFDNGRNVLQQWIVIDGQGRRTTVSLSNMQPGVKVAAKLFNVPRNGEGKPRVRKKTNFSSSRR